MLSTWMGFYYFGSFKFDSPVCSCRRSWLCYELCDWRAGSALDGSVANPDTFLKFFKTGFLYVDLAVLELTL